MKACSAALRLLSASIRKVAGGDDLLAALHALQHLDIAVAAAAELDRAGARRSSPSATSTTCRVPLSMTALAGTAATGFVGTGVEHHVGIHVDLQPPVRVGHLDADLGGARLRPQLRIDQHHLALELLHRIGAQRQGGVRPMLELRQVRFGHVGDDPQMRVVGDPIELVARTHPLAQNHLLLDHVSGGGCGPATSDYCPRALRGYGFRERRDCAAAARRRRHNRCGD